MEDKIIGIEQRAILRNLYLKEKNIDIFSYYIGTIVFSALELIMRLSDISFFSSRKELKRYMNMEDVRVGIKEIDVSHLPLKLRLPIIIQHIIHQRYRFSITKESSIKQFIFY